MKKRNKANYFGTYFNPDTISRISKVSKIFSWVILTFYCIQWILQVGVLFSQVARGFWTGLTITDIAQNLLWLLEPPLRGLVYFAVLQGVAQVLLMIMDIENNTR